MSVQFRIPDNLPEVGIIPRGPTWHVVDYKPEYSFPDIHPPKPVVPDTAPPTKSPDNSVQNQLTGAWALLEELKIGLRDTAQQLHSESQAAIASIGPMLDEIQRNGIRIFGLSSQVDEMVAQVSLEGYTRVNKDGALAGSIFQINANFDGLTAQFLDEALASATRDEAIAARITRLTSVMDGVVAQVSDEVVTRVNANEAFATSVSTLTAQFNLVSSQISTEQTVRSTADAAMASQINNLTTSLGGTSASLTSEAATRATADNALSGRIDTASTTLAGHTASISSIIGTQNGLVAQWAIQATIDGVTGGLVFTGLKRADGTGTTFDLEINANVTIHGTLLVDGTVANPKIAANAVSHSAASTGGSSSSTDSGVAAISARAGARIAVFAFYNGGDIFFSSIAGYSLNLYTSTNGSTWTTSNSTFVPFYITTGSGPGTVFMFACVCAFITTYGGSDGNFYAKCNTSGPAGFFNASCTIYVLELDK